MRGLLQLTKPKVQCSLSTRREQSTRLRKNLEDNLVGPLRFWCTGGLWVQTSSRSI